MTVTAFDTHAAVRAMQEAGLEAPQAEAVTDAIRLAVTEGVSTKTDIAELRSEMKSDIAELRSEMKSDMAELRADMARLEIRLTRTLYGVAAALLAGQLAAVLALLRLLG